MKVMLGEDILSSEKDDVSNTISINTGDAASGSTNPGQTEWWQHVGLSSRPSNITDKKDAAQALIFTKSNRDIGFASRDVRGHQIYGSLGAGETCLYAAGSDGNSQGRILLKNDGSINLYTRNGNTSSGGGMAVIINPSNDSITITNSKGYGLIIDEDGARLTSKGACLDLSGSGNINLIGTAKVVIDGTSIALGSKALPITPVIKGLTGIAGVPSIKVITE